MPACSVFVATASWASKIKSTMFLVTIARRSRVHTRAARVPPTGYCRRRGRWWRLPGAAAGGRRYSKTGPHRDKPSPSEAHETWVLLFEHLRRERGIRVDLSLNLIAIAPVVHQRGRNLGLRELGKGLSDSVSVLIPAEVPDDLPHAQTGSADFGRPTARLIGEIDTGAVPHSQRFVKQFLGDVGNRTSRPHGGRFEISSQRLT